MAKHTVEELDSWIEDTVECNGLLDGVSVEERAKGRDPDCIQSSRPLGDWCDVCILNARIEAEKARADAEASRAMSQEQAHELAQERIAELEATDQGTLFKQLDTYAKRIAELEARIDLNVDYSKQVAKLEQRNAELRKDNDALKQRLADAEALFVRVTEARAMHRADFLQAAHAAAEAYLTERGK